VQSDPLAGHQVGVDDLSEHGVTDVVSVLAGLGHQQLARDPGSQCPDQLLVVQPGHGRQQLMGHPSAGHRHHSQRLLGMVGQRLDPAAE
jgi:hypothetical protein